MGDCRTELVVMKLTFFFDQRWMRTISCLQTVFIGKKRWTNKFYQTFIYLFLSLSLLQLAIYNLQFIGKKRWTTNFFSNDNPCLQPLSSLSTQLSSIA
jgi:hypothetical protein